VLETVQSFITIGEGNHLKSLPEATTCAGLITSLELIHCLNAVSTIKCVSCFDMFVSYYYALILYVLYSYKSQNFYARDKTAS